jgi:hypothetical protein
MPENALAQEERNDRFRTGLHLPGFCQVSDEAIEVSIVFNQTVEDETVNVAGGGVLGQDRVEKGSIANRTDDELVDPPVRSIAFKNDADDQDDDKKNGKTEEKNLDLQKGCPFNETVLEYYRGKMVRPQPR